MNQPEMTLMQYKAWCEWRKWCSVPRVRNPEPTAEEITAGKVDDIPRDQREELYQYLWNTILKVIRSRLNAWYSKQSDRQHHFTEQDDVRFLSFFDEWMTGDTRKKAPGFSGNSYKDYIFFCIRQSSDSPGKIINGKIFKQHGYMDSIIVKILGQDVEFERGPRGGLRKKPRKLAPLEQNQSDEASDDNRSLLDRIASPEEPAYPDDAEIGKAAFQTLSREEKLILAASLCDVRISNPKLLAVLHCKKERAANLRDRLFKRLQNDFSELEEAAEAFDVMINLIISDLSAEKETKSFLLSIGIKEGDL